jgi:hypothetical protein
MMNVNPALRLTPSNSPFLKTSVNRSPTKAVVKAEEPGLHLKKVIGTTTASANGFDCLPSARQFAFTAGAAAVLATVDKDLNIQQQFFRANPASSANRDANTNWPVTASPGDRGRTLGYFKDQSGGAQMANGWPSAKQAIDQEFLYSQHEMDLQSCLWRSWQSTLSVCTH